MAEPVPIETLLKRAGISAPANVGTAYDRWANYVKVTFPEQLATWNTLTEQAERI